jgi:hypothetical protein
VGDPVVHSAHGIGRYRGLINMDLGQGTNADGTPLLQEFCTSNTPTAPRSTCPSASCT